MASTTNMNLTTWGPNDYFNDLDLRTNWEKVDAHDHNPSNDGGVQINSGGIANEAITTAKLDDNAVTGAKIADDTITKFKLANDLVVALETAAGALSSETVFGTLPTATVTGDYESLSVKDGALVNSHISDAAQISPSKIDIRTQSGAPLSANNTVVDSGAVTTSGTVTGPFSSLSVKANGVGTAEIVNSSVTTDKLSTGAVTSAKIANSTIAVEDLSSGVSSGLTSTSAAWTSYSPSLTTFGGSVTTSGVTIGGAYQKIHNTVVARIELNVGTYLITGNGTLALLFGLPQLSSGRVSGSWWADIYIASSSSIESYSGAVSAGSGASACALRGVSTLSATSSLARPNLSVGYTDGSGASYPQALWAAGSNLTITVTYQV